MSSFILSLALVPLVWRPCRSKREWEEGVGGGSGRREWEEAAIVYSVIVGLRDAWG